MTTDTLELDSFTLTPDQETALASFNLFLMDPVETVFVLKGYSGCGKSTLVRTLIDRLPNYQRAARLINPSMPEYEPMLTATTNKAAENLAQITGFDVVTIHAALGLRVYNDFKTNTSTLLPKQMEPLEGYVLFIDEASFMDRELLEWVWKRTKHCKIVFIGDPAQLSPVKSTGTPVFDAGFNGAALTQVVRQAEGNPIVAMSTAFRHTVNTGEWTIPKPDGHHIQHLDRVAFHAAIETEFTRPDWKYKDSKILAWTNKCVITFNQYVRGLAKGDPHFHVGDYAVVNSYIMLGKQSLKTDQLVQITGIGPDEIHHDVVGNRFTLDGHFSAFMPKSLADKNAAIKKARAENRIGHGIAIEEGWIDLRGAYACTINKAQGSTFDAVYIDLDDISRCNSGDQIARMLYVAVSRARNHVFLTGDLA